MRILLKLILWVVILLVGISASLAAYLMFFFNPNDYRTEIEERALSEAGIELHINGEIGWSFYPWLGLELQELSLNYPDQPQLAQLAQAGAALNIPALLGGTVQLDSILVDGLVLNLVRDDQGKENWVSKTDSPKQEEKGEFEHEGDAALRLAVDEISLRNASISFEDQIWSKRIELTDLTLNATAVSVDKPFPVSFSGSLQQSVSGQTETQAQMELKADVSINPEQQVLELRNLTTDLKIEQTGLKSPLEVNLASDIRLSQTEERLSVDNLRLSLAGLQLTGKLAVSNFSEQQIEGAISIPAFSPRELLTGLGAELPAMDKSALNQAELNLRLSGTGSSLLLEDLQLKIDDSLMTGQAAINSETGAIIANIKLDQIDLDRYMPETADASEAPASAGTEKGWSKDPLFDAEPLRGVDAELKLELGKALYQGNAIENLNLNLSAKGGDIRLKQLTAEAFGGKADISGAVDARTEPVKLAIKPNFSGVKLEQLMRLAMEETPVKADVNLGGSLTTTGNSMHQIVNALNGELKLSAAEGVVEGIDLAQELCQNIENITALGINPDQVDRTTPIADLKSDYLIKNGLVSNPNLSVGVDAAIIDAKGSINLPDQSFDYNLGMTLTGDLFKQSCGINPALKDVRIPVNCKGSFDTDPAKLCSLDPRFIEDMIKKAIGDKAQAEIEKRKDEIEQQAKQKLEENLGDKLKEGAGSLFKGLLGR